MPLTYIPINTTTISGSAVSSVTFSSIPSTYTDLVLVASIKCNTSNSNIKIQLNDDTGSNYSLTYGGSAGANGETNRATSQTSMDTAYQGADQFGNILYHFNNYSNTTTYKTVLSRSNNGSNFVGFYAGLWRSNSAISTIKLNSSTTNIAVDSTFTLYGIKAA